MGDQQNSLNLRVSKNRIVVYDRFLAPEEIMAVVDGGGLDVKPIKSATLAVNYKTTLGNQHAFEQDTYKPSRQSSCIRTLKPSKATSSAGLHGHSVGQSS